jgi:hypothetical protein
MINEDKMVRMIKINLGKEESFRNEILSQLEKHSSVGVTTVEFLRKHNVSIKFRTKKHSAAAWTLTGNIELNLAMNQNRKPSKDPYILSLVIHEARHLQQGLFKALSVYGELDAWQVGFKFYKDLIGSPLDPLSEEILHLPLNWSRTELIKAAKLMKKYSPLYRIDLLPLYPLPHEIVWWVTRKEPI